jgi:hypothetical protein
MADDTIEIGLPERMELHRHGSYIEIVRRWFSGTTILLTAFVVFWDGFLIMWYSIVPKDASLMFRLFPLIHVAVGVGLTYSVIAGWFNRTYIYVGHRRIAVRNRPHPHFGGKAVTVRHRPIPWLGNKVIPADDVKQLYSKEKTQRSRNGTTIRFEVQIITRGGKNTKLVGGLESREQALFIEQEIENYLGIKDAPVKAEL